MQEKQAVFLLVGKSESILHQGCRNALMAKVWLGTNAADTASRKPRFLQAQKMFGVYIFAYELAVSKGAAQLLAGKTRRAGSKTSACLSCWPGLFLLAKNPGT